MRAYGEDGLTLILVEDDPGHARLLQKNLRRAGFDNRIVHFEDGREALDFLLEEGTFAGRRRPENPLVLLDINMPGMNGYQVLEHLKGDPRSRNIPVFMLTTTDDRREVERCYRLGCNGYLTKPVEYDDFSRVVSDLGHCLGSLLVPA